METIIMFDTEQQARDYRYRNGTGGWIFKPENEGLCHYHHTQSILFPPSYTPSMIFNHPIAKGRIGLLIGG